MIVTSTSCTRHLPNSATGKRQIKKQSKHKNVAELYVRNSPPPRVSSDTVVPASPLIQLLAARDDYNERKNGKPPSFDGRLCRWQNSSITPFFRCKLWFPRYKKEFKFSPSRRNCVHGISPPIIEASLNRLEARVGWQTRCNSRNQKQKTTNILPGRQA
jgi:hypothetical protein